MKKTSCIVFLVSLLAVAFVASPASAALELSLWDWHTPRVELYEEWAARYNEMQDRVEIKVNQVSWGEFWDKLPIAIASGTPPALAQFHNEKANQFVTDQELMLTPFPEQLFDFGEMAERYLMFNQAVMLDGRMYYFPAGIMTAGIFYNTDLMQAAGMSVPPNTWTDMLQAAKKLTKTTPENLLTQVGFRLDWNILVTDMVYQQGGYLFDGTKALIDTPEVHKAVSTIQTFYDAHVTDRPGEHNPGNFESGKVAMRYRWTWAYGHYQGIQGLNFSVARLPSFDGGKYPALGRNNYECGLCVPAGVSPEKQIEAFRFIKWLYDQDEFYVRLNKTLGRIPGRPELWDHPLLQDDPVFDMLREQAPWTVYPGPLPSWYFGTLNEIYNHVVVNQDMAPAAAIQQAQELAIARAQEEPPRHIVERMYQPPQ